MPVYPCDDIGFSLISCQTSTPPPRSPVGPPESSVSGPIAEYVQTAPTEEQARVAHKTLKAVTRDLETIGFNTAIARMMEFVNYYTKQETRPKQLMEMSAFMLSPMAPHIVADVQLFADGVEDLGKVIRNFHSKTSMDIGGNFQALAPLDMTLNSGEIAVLEGPNGSGKSTLLSLITGDHPLTAVGIGLGVGYLIARWLRD